MSNLLVKASQERGEFFELIGKDVTFASDYISIGGFLLHSKGEKAFISDVEYTTGYWSRFYAGYVEAKISTIQVNGITATCWALNAFEEFQKQRQ